MVCSPARDYRLPPKIDSAGRDLPVRCSRKASNYIRTPSFHIPSDSSYRSILQFRASHAVVTSAANICLFNCHAVEVCWGVEIQRHPAFIRTQTEHFSCREYTFRTRFMSVGLYADTCRHVSQYFACSLQFGCCAVRLDLCVRRKKLKDVRFGVYVVVFRCRFSRPGPLSIADGGTAFLSNVGTSRPRMPECSPQQNQTGAVCSEVCHLGVLLLHTRNLSSCVQPCTVFCTSLKLCVPSDRICESRGVFPESRTACLHA